MELGTCHWIWFYLFFRQNEEFNIFSRFDSVLIHLDCKRLDRDEEEAMRKRGGDEEEERKMKWKGR